MRVTLAGPDDLGYWFLHDENGDAFPLVARHEDHPVAAELFGWTAPEGITDQEEIIESARLWLMENISEEIEAPQHAVEFFRQLNDEEE
jgi:hypothetical protein